MCTKATFSIIGLEPWPFGLSNVSRRSPRPKSHFKLLLMACGFIVPRVLSAERWGPQRAPAYLKVCLPLYSSLARPALP